MNGLLKKAGLITAQARAPVCKWLAILAATALVRVRGYLEVICSSAVDNPAADSGSATNSGSLEWKRDKLIWERGDSAGFFIRSFEYARLILVFVFVSRKGFLFVLGLRAFGGRF